MNTVNALVNLGDISRPATVLIEKISDAIGGIAKPGQIVRVAKAEAKADVARAEGRIQITEIEERALQRMVREEGKRQDNIETITAKAIPQLNDDATPEKVEDDWLTHFFDRCRLVSDGEMQTLWANMLAGQANNPGRFKKNTINIVSVCDKTDAEIFTRFCSFVWEIADIATPVIFDYNNKTISDVGINFLTLTHLDDMGLITFNDHAEFAQLKLKKHFSVSYYGHPVNIEFEDEENSLEFGMAMLTHSGMELFEICGSEPNEDHYNHVLSEWTKKRCTISFQDGTKFIPQA